MRLPKFKKPNLKLILLYYSVILSTILIIGGVYSNRSIKEIISNIYDIAAGDKYVISHEDKLANAIWKYTSSTLTSFGTLVSDIWFNSPRTLTDYASSTIATAVWSNSTRTFSEFSSLAADIWNIWNSTFAPKTLASRQIGTSTEYIASQATLEAVRSSQQEGWTIYLSDIGQLLAGKTYWVKVTILNYESVPTDPYATSTITIYDASRNIVVENVQMTKISTGVYEYTYNIPSSAGAGLWETVVSTEVETGKTIIVNDHWEVESSPAEVKINQITDHTISSITANATITNEDSGDYEYQYEYCIVSSLENQCGGGDDIDYAKTVKYIQAGQSWTTDLTLSASSVGTYYFKMVVYWGTERFEDYKQFEAIKEVTPLSESGGGS